MSERSAGFARTVFIDSSAYFALTDHRSIDHRSAQTILRRFADAGRRLVTTNFIVAETHALILNRLHRGAALGFLEWLDRSGTVFVRVRTADERRAREIIETYEDKDFSFTDGTSFAVMERLRIGQAFSFDRHFLQYGFLVVGLEQ
jgi:predicted nucleic acid-binding protein